MPLPAPGAREPGRWPADSTPEYQRIAREYQRRPAGKAPARRVKSAEVGCGRPEARFWARTRAGFPRTGRSQVDAPCYRWKRRRGRALRWVMRARPVTKQTRRRHYAVPAGEPGAVCRRQRRRPRRRLMRRWHRRCPWPTSSTRVRRYAGGRPEFKCNEFYIPEVLMAARDEQSMEKLRPLIAESGIQPIARLPSAPSRAICMISARTWWA